MIKENPLKVAVTEVVSAFCGEVFVRTGDTIHIIEKITVLCSRG